LARTIRGEIEQGLRCGGRTCPCVTRRQLPGINSLKSALHSGQRLAGPLTVSKGLNRLPWHRGHLSARRVRQEPATDARRNAAANTRARVLSSKPLGRGKNSTAHAVNTVRAAKVRFAIRILRRCASMCSVISIPRDATPASPGLHPERRMIEEQGVRLTTSGIVHNGPMAKVIRPRWRVSVSVPPEAQLWDVEGIPVAVIPVQGGIPLVQAFDSPIPRPLSRFSVLSRGKPTSRGRWDALVNRCRRERPASGPP
jgi:hypothetical protein